MGRLVRLTTRNYRSIREGIALVFPERLPLVLIGENNAGKSNIVKALDLVLGETWPGNYEPEDHEFHERDRDNSPIEISAEVQGIVDIYRGNPRQVSRLIWTYPPHEGRSFFMELPGGDLSPYVNNDVRAQCLCIVISADRRLSYQLSYASKYTFLSRLMRKFHDRLMADPDRVGRLHELFGELRLVFQEVEQFAEFVEELRTQAGELSGNLAYGLGIDFSAYDPSNYFRALRVQPEEGGETRAFEELGTGQEQILALSFAYAYAKAFHDAGGLMLVIEEPEAHLHPLAQEWVARKIRELAAEGVQIVVTTHSPAFLDIMGLEGVALVRKPEGKTQVVQMSRESLAASCQKTGADRATAENVLPFYSAAATMEILAGFFARTIVLVEGPTEALALPAYLSKVGLEAAREGVAFVPVGGVGNLAKWWRLLNVYGIPAYVVFDNDCSEDADGNRRRDLLRALNVDESAHADVLDTTEWIIDNRFAVFGGNFETVMRSYLGEEYQRLEADARAQFGLTNSQSKPLVARYVAERLRLQEHPEGQARFETLAGMIRGSEGGENNVL